MRVRVRVRVRATSHVEVGLGQAQARAEGRLSLQHPQPLGRIVAQRGGRRVHEVSVGLDGGTADAATQLMELGEAELQQRCEAEV